MDQRPATPPPWLPAVRRPRPSAPVPEHPPAVPDPPPPAADRSLKWRRITRSPRGAAGLAIAAAALLLWPFSGWSWIPWLAGLGALVVLRLLRIDGLLRGWDLHLAGLVVVAGLMLSTGPWAWALAGGLGVLLAGLGQLPRWRLAAVGAVLCVVSGVGFGIDSFRAAEVQRQVEARAGDSLRVQLGETRPDLVLPAMLRAVELDDADPICRLLAPGAEAELLRVVGAPDCSAAVSELHRRSASVDPADEQSLPRPQPAPGGWVVEGCASTWASAAGPELGRIAISQTDPAVRRFAVIGFARC